MIGSEAVPFAKTGGLADVLGALPAALGRLGSRCRTPPRVGGAHLIEAGADMFLMPSRFEPCGLNQKYSQRYGTVPIVHAVGGLIDTVQDCTPQAGRNSTGFMFREYTAAALLAALRRALAAFSDKRGWRALQSTGMRQDNSWDRSAREYVKIYERVLRT